MAPVRYSVTAPLGDMDVSRPGSRGYGHVQLTRNLQGTWVVRAGAMIGEIGQVFVSNAQGGIVIARASADDALDTARAWLREALPGDVDIAWGEPFRVGGALYDTFTLRRSQAAGADETSARLDQG